MSRHCFHWSSVAILFCSPLFLLLQFAPHVAQASQVYLVSDQTAGAVWRLEDGNGDGDALDVGEKQLWADGLVSIVELEQDSSRIFAVEEGLADGLNQIFRFTDVNGDGDALDVGERTIWADGFDNPRGISHDGQGAWYVTEIDDHLVWRLTDTNGDGDALDLGERTLYADGILGAATVAHYENSIFVTAFYGGQVHRLVDVNRDGDALDTSENLVITSPISLPLGLLGDGDGGIFVSSFDGNSVFHSEDHNGDGDMLDITETLSYADTVFGGITGPWDMAPHNAGGFLLAEYLDGQVVWVRDTNGDGDALDLGEARLFADGFDRPVDIVPWETILAGDYNNDGVVGAADYTAWRDNLGAPAGTLPNDIDGGVTGPAQYATWKTNFGTISGSGSLSGANVPEPASDMLFAWATVAMCLRRRWVLVSGTTRASTFLDFVPWGT